MSKERIMEQLNMIGRKVDIITEGYTKDQIEENIDFFIEQDKHEPEYVSTSCSHSAFGNSFDEEELTGICGKCYDGANFDDLYGEDQ